MKKKVPKVLLLYFHDDVLYKRETLHAVWLHENFERCCHGNCKEMRILRTGNFELLVIGYNVTILDMNVN